MSRSSLQSAARARTLPLPEARQTRRRRGGNEQDVSLTARVPALAPFQIRSFRFQWPADLLASWAFEMEGVILGWFVLVSTGSVLALARVRLAAVPGHPDLAAVRHGGRPDRQPQSALPDARHLRRRGGGARWCCSWPASPRRCRCSRWPPSWDWCGHPTSRCATCWSARPCRPSYLMRAMGVSRTTRRLGARRRRAVGRGPGRGAGLGRGLCRGLRRLRREPRADAQCRHQAAARAGRDGASLLAAARRCARASPMSGRRPTCAPLMLLAFLMNFAAYPLVGSLLAYVAKDIYGLDQTGLGWLIACFAGGALAGLDRASRRTAPASGRPAPCSPVRCRVVRAQSRLLLDQRAAAGAKSSCSSQASCKASA